MKRRRLLSKTLIITSALILLAKCENNQLAKTNNPNIIFILADDLGYGDLGCYGQDKIQTPNIDKLAQEGLRFTQFYAGATVCAPSRSVLMTGQHTGHTRVRGNMCKVGGTVGYKNNRQVRRMNLTTEDKTIGHMLQSAGYKTCLVGKWHLGGYDPEAGPLDRGFDEFYGRLTRTDDLHKPAYWPAKWFHNRELVDITANQNNEKGYYRTDMNTDNAIQFIKKNHQQPFFLFLSYSNPHSPYDTPNLGPYEKKEWPTEEKTYASMIHHLDLSVGKLMKTLESLKIGENTIVFFCSDNGPRSEPTDFQTRTINFFNSNGALTGYKRDLYEGGIRVPMIVRWPDRVPKGKTSEAAWYFADVLPTLAEVAGARSPDNVDGISALPYLINPNKLPADRFLYWEFFEGGFQQAVRWKKWKAIRLNPGEPLKLYDLSQDITEEVNVAGQNPKIIEHIETYLKTARSESSNWPLDQY